MRSDRYRWYARGMRKLAFALLVAACGGSDNHQQVTVIDAPIDTTPDSPPAQPVQVSLDVFGATPSLIAYRDGAGAWQTPTPGSNGKYTLTVTADYQVVVACHDTANAFSELLEATAADGSQFMFCNLPGGGTMPTTVAMTGHMVQAGDVQMSDTASSTTAPWDFTLNVPAGTYDLFATSAAHGMVIRRDQVVTTAGALASIDVASEGTPMTATDLTVSGVGSDSLTTEIDLFTNNGVGFWSGNTTTVYPPPAALLTANDFEYVFVEAFTQTTARYAETQFTGSETTFDLPAVLTGIVFGPGKASWGTLPAYDQVSLDLQQGGGTLGLEQTIIATKGWIDATHATQVAFDAMPPGFDASWSIDPSTSYQRMFEVEQLLNQVSYVSMVFDNAALQRVVNRPKFSTVARLRESIRSQHTMPRR